MRLIDGARRWERRTRPVDPEYAHVLRRRWARLPEHVKTPGQFLGRHAVGCEGTHGVFPRCNLACTPCYHSRDANRVRVDGAHTIAEVDKQMALLRHLRGPRAHAQLIGGEVTLLDPDDHAETLLTMRRYGREPMSMSHGDFDYDYLERLTLDKQGRPRLKRISFAGHFDMTMFGRRGIPRASSERELNLYRQRFVDMFKHLRAKHGVSFFLAHNMTVTPANLNQVADLVRDCHAMGFGMFSFQPAAFVGDDRRWHENYQQVGMEEVWREIEKGAGTALDYTLIQHGDLRCNRAAYGFYVGPRWHPVLSGDPGDLAAREAFFRYFGETNFAGVELPDVIGKVVRTIVRHPVVMVIALQWLVRLVRRVGGLPTLLCHGVRPVSFVVHQFMDAADVAPAWELMKRGKKATEPRVLAAQERLAACHYAMAHPESGELVPACVQHCVLDPVENIELRRLLPIVDTRAS
ncbi:MAG: hypothetical protein JO287_08050 [Pseudonocardiales bacterium]|nr:hypothetical protein [Pseudonocardiales bacterium]